MKKIFLLCIGVLFLMSSCKKSFTVNTDNSSIGKAAEVLLVMDKDVWPDDIQDSVKKLLTIPQEGLNQAEAMFDVLHIDHDIYTSDKQRHANIVEFVVSEKDSIATFSLEHNPYSSPQTYVKIKGNNGKSCLDCFIEHHQEILSSMYNTDIEKIQGAYEKILNVSLQRYIKDKFGILLTVTKDYNIAREGEDFLWLGYRTAVNDRFLMIYRSDSTILTKETLINDRNRVCRQYIEGHRETIHPIVVEMADYPLFSYLQIGNKKGAELRGLWETENDYMGGPFYHFSFINAQNKCISIDGFVYAPTEEKRNYLRQVEAIVKSVR